MVDILKRLARSVAAFFYGLGRLLFGGLHLRKRIPFANHIQNFLARHARPDCVTTNGYVLYLDVTEGISAGADFEPETTALFKRFVRPGDIVLDIGADVGYYSCLAAKLVGSAGQVFAFEPNSRTNRFLQKNIAANKFSNVTIVPRAVSDQKEVLPLFANGPHTSVGYDRFGEGKPTSYIETVTLDGFFRDRNQRIDFVKIDAEGSEGKVSRGMLGILGKNRAIKVVMEFYPLLLAGAGEDLQQFLSVFEGIGFSFYDASKDPNVSHRLTTQEILDRYPRENNRMTNLFLMRTQLK